MSPKIFNEVLKKLVERVEEREDLEPSKKQYMLNRIDLKGFKHVQEKYTENRDLCKKELEVKGTWLNNLEYGPQFQTKLKTERAGEILVQTDEITLMGGQGTALHPISLCLAGFCGCFSAAFAKWAAMEGIELEELRITTKADVDLSKPLGIDLTKPLVDNFKIKLFIQSDASLDELNKIAEYTKQRCFCHYCISTPIEPKVTLNRGKPPEPFAKNRVNINKHGKKNQSKRDQMNRLDLKAFKETREVYAENPALCKKTLDASGNWRLGVEYGPQFETTIETERAGDITVQTDETIILGGGGTSFHPVALCIAGFSACFLTTFARWAAIKGIPLDSLNIHSRMFIDLTTSFGIEPNIPMIDDFFVDIFTENNAQIEKLQELIDLAKRTSFCFNCYSIPITPELVVKKISEKGLKKEAFISKTKSKEQRIHIREPHNIKSKISKEIEMIELL
ncbi:MAG: OsmC family protein [Promethearchaeia archaeon]